MPVRVGVVGAGWVGGQHLKALSKLPEAQVVAICDVDMDRAVEAAARIAGAGAYSDLSAMLSEQELDAVYVCVPPNAHGPLEMALIERGLPFFVEKPLAADRDTPLMILEAVQRKRLLTSVGYMMRYRQTVGRLREFLSGAVPVAARGIYACNVPPPPWWRRKEQSGGQVVEQSTHIFDLARYLFGEVEWVFCAARRGLVREVPDYNVEDASICTLGFKGGLLCEITSTCAVQTPEAGEISLEVFARTGRAKLSGGNLDLTLTLAGEVHQVASRDDVFLAEDQAFIAAVAGGDASGIRSSYEDAVRTHLVTCAANQSMESGQLVRL